MTNSAFCKITLLLSLMAPVASAASPNAANSLPEQNVERWTADVTLDGSFTKNVNALKIKGKKIKFDKKKAFSPKNTTPVSERMRIVLIRDNDGELFVETGKNCIGKLVPTEKSAGRKATGKQGYAIDYAITSAPMTCLDDKKRPDIQTYLFLKEDGLQWHLLLIKEWDLDSDTPGSGSMQGEAILRGFRKIN